MEETRPDRLGRELEAALQGYRRNAQDGCMDAAMDCAEHAAALALFAYGRESRQLGQPLTTPELTEFLQSNLLPHQNRGSIQNRHSEIAAQVRDILVRSSTPGIRSAKDKEQLSQAWLELAVSLARIPVRYNADNLKQQQRQQPAAMKMEVC